MSTERTLTLMGVKEVNRVCGSKNSTTHTYTAMPTISRGGKLQPKLFVILQESEGKFGPAVVEDVSKLSNKYKNLVVTCSQSGKMESRHFDVWYKECIEPLVSDHEPTLLLLDSYGSHKTKRKSLIQQENEANVLNLDQELAMEDEQPAMIDIEIIPEGTTSLVQPLDRFFFRQFKIVYRLLINLLVQKNIRDPLKYQPVHLREVQLRLISLIHSQFTAPIFEFMIRGAFDLCGYATADGEPSERFKSANEILFDLREEVTNERAIQCSKSECSNVSFIKCSHCREICCLDCFVFTDDHFHFPEDLAPTNLDYERLGMKRDRKRKAPASTTTTPNQPNQPNRRRRNAPDTA